MMKSFTFFHICLLGIHSLNLSWCHLNLSHIFNFKLNIVQIHTHPLNSTHTFQITQMEFNRTTNLRAFLTTNISIFKSLFTSNNAIVKTILKPLVILPINIPIHRKTKSSWKLGCIEPFHQPDSALPRQQLSQRIPCNSTSFTNIIIIAAAGTRISNNSVF